MIRLPGRLLPLISLPLLLLACQRQLPRSEGARAFVFRSLQLRHQDPAGRTGWELSSPEARYDIRRRLARARDPRGMIFAAGAPLYRLSASTGTVLNDGEMILLEGEARIERLGGSPAMIRSRRLRWLPAQRLVLLDRDPEASSGPYRLQARSARLRLDRDLLELEGQPLLQRWPQGAATGKGSPELVVRMAQVAWSPGSGALTARGPIDASRQGPAPGAGRGGQRLLAPALTGNTREGLLQLAAPVRLSDPAEGVDLELGAVRFLLADQQATSPAPFQGRIGSATVSGTGLLLSLPERAVEVNAACRLRRPDAELAAGRCRWGWGDGRIRAEGDVVLHDRLAGRTTRSQLLEGHLGPDSQVQFSSPGGRVISRVPLPNG